MTMNPINQKIQQSENSEIHYLNKLANLHEFFKNSVYNIFTKIINVLSYVFLRKNKDNLRNVYPDLKPDYSQSVELAPDYSGDLDLESDYAQSVGLSPDYSEDSSLEEELNLEGIGLSPDYSDDSDIESDYTQRIELSPDYSDGSDIESDYTQRVRLSPSYSIEDLYIEDPYLSNVSRLSSDYQGDLDTESDYAQSVELSPDYSEYSDLGHVVGLQSDSSDDSDIESDYTQSVGLSPDYSEYSDLGHVVELSPDYSEDSDIESDYAQKIELSPDSEDLYIEDNSGLDHVAELSPDYSEDSGIEETNLENVELNHDYSGDLDLESNHSQTTGYNSISSIHDQYKLQDHDIRKLLHNNQFVNLLNFIENNTSLENHHLSAISNFFTGKTDTEPTYHDIHKLQEFGQFIHEILVQKEQDKPLQVTLKLMEQAKILGLIPAQLYDDLIEIQENLGKLSTADIISTLEKYDISLKKQMQIMQWFNDLNEIVKHATKEIDLQ